MGGAGGETEGRDRGERQRGETEGRDRGETQRSGDIETKRQRDRADNKNPKQSWVAQLVLYNPPMYAFNNYLQIFDYYLFQINLVN